MNNLLEILYECGIEEYEAAEILYSYLCEYGESDNDWKLLMAIYERFFKRD